KPGNNDSSPQEKLAGSPPKVLSISVPSIRRTAKCKVIRVCGPAFSSSVMMTACSQQDIEYDQNRPHGNRRIGDIESRKMLKAPVEIQKVHHMPKHDPVIEVTQCA